MNSMTAAASTCSAPLVPAGAGRQKHQKGPQALAAGVNNVGGDLVDQCNGAVQTLFDDPVNGVKIGTDQVANSF
jgi:hypothetical protein